MYNIPRSQVPTVDSPPWSVHNSHHPQVGYPYIDFVCSVSFQTPRVDPLCHVCPRIGVWIVLGLICPTPWPCCRDAHDGVGRWLWTFREVANPAARRSAARDSLAELLLGDAVKLTLRPVDVGEGLSLLASALSSYLFASDSSLFSLFIVWLRVEGARDDCYWCTPWDCLVLVLISKRVV